LRSSRYEELLIGTLQPRVECGESEKRDIKTSALAIYSLHIIVRWYLPGGVRHDESFAAKFFELIHQGPRFCKVVRLGPGSCRNKARTR
jgi:hypothetical protein